MPAYPGLGLPLTHNPDDHGNYPIGANDECRGSLSDLITVRELAMMNIMESLTDKPDWHKKVYNEDIISKWRDEALAIPDEYFWGLAINAKSKYWGKDGKLDFHDDNVYGEPLKGILSATSFDCELRSKAKYFERTGIIPTLDASASVAKSDVLVSSDLHKDLGQAAASLKAVQAASPDWHPDTNEMVQDLVHPSMYPLIYGRSKVLEDEHVGLQNAIRKWAGKGTVIPKPEPPSDFDPNVLRFRRDRDSLWSDTYQWLPSNLKFEGDGSVKFSSYINNLHPEKFPGVYRSIEKLIDAALPLWDQCLAAVANHDQTDGAGRTTSRFGHFDNPELADIDSDDNGDNWIPSDPEEVANVKVDWDKHQDEVDYDPHFYKDDPAGLKEHETQLKWEILRKPHIPEPIFKDVGYVRSNEKRLAEKFRVSGLQVIVKIASIELTPEKPEFPMGGWHIEGQMNEHICGTALYYFDCENVTSSNLSFRMQTPSYVEGYQSVGQYRYYWLQLMHGTNLGNGNSNYGSVETREGRLLAFPNVLVSPFKLQDATKPGHRRFIALWLVDPTQRVISTANVPPQQADWWVDSILGDTVEGRKSAAAKLPAEVLKLMKERGLGDGPPTTAHGKLPPELADMIREHFNADDGALPIGIEEAKEHRQALMKARGAFVRNTEQAGRRSYTFCEH